MKKRIASTIGITFFVILLLYGATNFNIGDKSFLKKAVLKKENTAFVDRFYHNAFWKNRLKNAKEQYEHYISFVDDSLYKYRENWVGNISYALYDRFYYYDMYGLPGGAIRIFSEDENICLGMQMNLRCSYVNDLIRGSVEHDSKEEDTYFCEYYSLEDMNYFSFTQNEKIEKMELPNFMCMKGWENLRECVPGNEYYTIYSMEAAEKESFVFEEKSVDEHAAIQREFLEINGELFWIDRERKMLFSIAEDGWQNTNGNTVHIVECVFASWMKNQIELCNELLVEKTFTLEQIQNIVPEGYYMRRSHGYTAADMDGDGKTDILAIICPLLDEYEDKSWWGPDSVYAKIPEYYYEELWFFKGMEDGGYQKERLMEADSVVWDDGLVLVDLHGTTNGFTMEYFTGRAPFITALRKFSYNKETEGFYLEKIFENDSYENGIVIYNEMNFGAGVSKETDWNYPDEGYYISLNEYINGNYGDLLSIEYNDYGGILRIQDEALANRIDETLEQETDALFAAMIKLDECHGALIQESVVYQNTNIVVIEFTFHDDTEAGISVIRRIPITIDLQTGGKIDYREYITGEELEKMLSCTGDTCESSSNIKLFESYDDYKLLLASNEDSMTVYLSQEGLVILNTQQYWPDYCLVRRSNFIGTPLAQLWDDWP